MQKITALKPQKHNKERFNVYLDGEFAFGLAMDAAVGLAVGDTLSAERVAALQDEDAFARARDRAMRYLSYRPRSIAEVRRNLRRKDVDEALVERVIAYLREYDYLNDREFARYWVEQREAFKPRGRLALQQELRQKGVARAIIDEAVEEVDEEDAARRAAEKRFRRWSHLPYDEFRTKMGAYLQRRGFHYGIIRTTVEAIWTELASEEAPEETK